MESYHGLVLSERDALILIEASRKGKINTINRRMTKRERLKLICNGAVFVWEEDSSNIRRWTDGMSWTSSRPSGKFLIYNQIDFKIKKRLSYLNKEELVKQLFVLTLNNGCKYHVISYCYLNYYKKLINKCDNNDKNLLIRPSHDINLNQIQLSKEILGQRMTTNIDSISKFHNGITEPRRQRRLTEPFENQKKIIELWHQWRGFSDGQINADSNYTQPVLNTDLYQPLVDTDHDNFIPQPPVMMHYGNYSTIPELARNLTETYHMQDHGLWGMNKFDPGQVVNNFQFNSYQQQFIPQSNYFDMDMIPPVRFLELNESDYE